MVFLDNIHESFTHFFYTPRVNAAYEKKMYKYLSLLCIGLLACGGVDSDPIIGSNPNSNVAFLSAKLGRMSSIFQVSSTPISSMPTGSATYKGSAAYRSDTANPSAILRNPTLLSDFQVHANFSSGVLSLDFYNFITLSGNQRAIELSGTGHFVPNTASFFGTLSGFVGTDTANTISGDHDGSILGNNGSLIGGSVQVNMASEDALYGVFAGEAP